MFFAILDKYLILFLSNILIENTLTKSSESLPHFFNLRSPLLSFGFIVNFQGVKVSWASELELGLSVLLLDDNAYERNKK